MKRLIVIALTIMMCLIGKAESWTDGNGTTWNFNISGGKATISSGGTYSGDLTIPSTVYVGETAYTVTSIGEFAFYGCSSLTSINIPEGVTRIEGNAFMSCSNLTSINIPEGVTSIGGMAFNGCSSLKSINIPEGVTSIEGNAFSECSSLTSINIPEGVTSIGEWAFSNCSSLTSINIPEGVTSIGSYAFYGCYKIQSLYITDVKKYMQISFGDSYSCPLCFTNKDVKLYVDNTLVSTLDIPEGITTIPDHAFKRCSSLTSIHIPEGVTSIGASAFYGCSSLTSINIPEGVTSIGDHAFYSCSSLTSINIPENVTSIGDEAFWECYNIQSLYITDIKKWLQISFGNSHSCPLTSTHDVKLYVNNALVSTLDIPEGITTIPDYAFYRCSSLTSINIPEGVTSIGSNAFHGCQYLYFADETPCTISNNSFSTTHIIFVPDNAVEAYRTAWATFSNNIVRNSYQDVLDVTVSALPSSSALAAEIGEANLTDVVKLKVSGTINSYDMMIIRNKMINLRELDLQDANIVANDYQYYQGNSSQDNVFGGSFLRDAKIRSVVLPTSVTSIGDYAFYNCTNLSSVSNLGGITSIGDYAFYDCSNLPSIDLPNSLSYLGPDAFRNCSKFTSITIPKGVTSIGSCAFDGCSNLQSVQLSPQTTQISSSAFSECSRLTEFRLPPYLQSIGDYTFSSCSNLKDIYAYMVDVPTINTNTFNDYQHQILYVPQFLYNKYYYDTNWSQFLDVRVCELRPGDYTHFYTNSDVTFEDGERIDLDTPDVEIGEQGGVIVEGDDPQNFDDVEQNVDGSGTGGSIIGEEEGNIIVNKLKLKLQVKANEWIGFNFPYDVTIADCEYPGQYAWIEYDGEARANGNSGWKVVEGTKLTANKGYMFMSSAKGKLIVTFDHPSFGGDKEKPLQSYASGNAANAGWNFIGNPYSSYYEFNENDFSAPVTIWNGTSYVAYRPGDDDIHLHPYQAFFVQMPQHVYVVNFDKGRQETYTQSQKAQTNQAKMRKTQGLTPERLLINLNIGDQETESIDRTRLVLNEKASRNYEMECDAAKFVSETANAQLYMVENGVQMAINERPTEGDIQLGYMAKQAGTLRIDASRMDMPMVLVDTKTNQTFDLSLGSYEFQTEPGTFDKRFMLRLSNEATAIKNLTEKTGVAVGTQDGGLSIGGAEGKTISIYTANGTQVAQQSGNGFVGLPSGLYLVTVDSQSAKIYVK